jgi:O-antigen/teichoic acid export membrane protein
MESSAEATEKPLLAKGGSEPAPSGLMRDLWVRYSDTIGQQVFTAACGTVSGLLTPRLLGPQGRGELAAATVWPITIIFLTSFGLERATIFFSGKYKEDPSAVLTACASLGGFQTLLAMLIGIIVIPFALKNSGAQAVRWGLIFMLGAPIIRLDSLQGSLLIGALKTRWYNLVVTIPLACYAIGITLLFLMKVPSVPWIVIIRLIGVTIAAVLGFVVVRRQLLPRWNWQPTVTKEILKYGIKTNGGEISHFMNFRLDQLLMSMFLPNASLGLYVAAVAVTDALCIVPRGIAVVTLATGSNSSPATAVRWAKRSLVLTAAWILPTAALGWVFSPALIPRIFGAPFVGAVLPCRILLLGTCALAFNIVLNEASRSINHPEISSYAELCALAVTGILLALLLKPFGPVGAAVASAAAYTSALAFTTWYLCFRHSEYLGIHK